MAELTITLTARYIEQHLDQLRDLASALIDAGEDPDELVNTTLSSVVGGKVKNRSRVVPYIKAAMRRQRAQQLRSDDRRRRRESAAARNEVVTSPEEAAAIADDARLLAEVVAELPEKLRSVVTRHFMDERTIADIAKEDGVSDRAIRYRVRDAREAIRIRLQEKDPKRDWKAIAGALAWPSAGAAVRTSTSLAPTLGAAALLGGAAALAVWVALPPIETAAPPDGSVRVAEAVAPPAGTARGVSNTAGATDATRLRGSSRPLHLPSVGGWRAVASSISLACRLMRSSLRRETRRRSDQSGA